MRSPLTAPAIDLTPEPCAEAKQWHWPVVKIDKMGFF
jgi:hypothetical protein